MSRSKKLKQCAFCGVYTAKWTRDHIPPQGIFPEPRPNNLITLSACARCNRETSNLDEEFKFAASVEPDRAQDLWTNGAWRTLQHNNRLKFQVAGNLVRAVSDGDDGGEQLILNVPRTQDDRMIVKIVQGLYFYHFSEVIGGRVQVGAQRIGQPSHWEAWTANVRSNVVGHDQFIYRYERDPIDPLLSHWLLTFYGRHHVEAITAPGT